MRQIASHWCANRQTNDSLRVTFACNNEKTNVIRLILIFAVFVRDTQLFQAWKFGYYGCSRYSERSYVHDYIDSKIHKNLPLQSSVVLKSELFEEEKLSRNSKLLAIYHYTSPRRTATNCLTLSLRVYVTHVPKGFLVTKWFTVHDSVRGRLCTSFLAHPRKSVSYNRAIVRSSNTTRFFVIEMRYQRKKTILKFQKRKIWFVREWSLWKDRSYWK